MWRKAKDQTPTVHSQLVREKFPSYLANYLKEHCYGNTITMKKCCLSCTLHRAAESPARAAVRAALAHAWRESKCVQKKELRQSIYTSMHTFPDLRTIDITFNNSLFNNHVPSKFESFIQCSKSTKQLALFILQIQQLAHDGNSRG